MLMLSTLIFLSLCCSPAIAPNEGSASDSFIASCPPKTKHSPTTSAGNSDQANRCFVAEYGIDLKKPCSGELPEQLLNLSDFQATDVSGLLGIGGSGIANEADLILSRAGIFDWFQQPLDHLSVCENHYALLGRRSKPKRMKASKQNVLACTAPYVEEIAGKHPADKTVRAGNFFATKEQAQVLMEKTQKLIRVGEALCRYHHDYLQNLIVDHRREMKGYEFRHAPRIPFASALYNQAGLQHIQQEHPSCIESAGAGADSDFLPHGNPEDEEDDDDTGDPTAATIKMFIRKIAEESRIPHLHFTNRFGSLTPETKLRRASAAERLFKIIIELMAKDNPDELHQLIQTKRNRRAFVRQHTEKVNQLLDSVAEAFMNAPTTSLKRQTLSLVALYIPYRELVEYIPTLTLYYYKVARRHAKKYGAGNLIPDHGHAQERYDRKKVDMFVEFITSPHVVVDLPYGTAKVKRQSGVKEEIPNLIRVMNDEHIITQYLTMLEQNGEQQYALSRSSLRRILSVCTAQTRKSLQGLDYFTNSAASAFDTLNELSEKLGEYNQDHEWKIDIQNRLRHAKQFLKQQYKFHVRRSSSSPDFCMTYALNDTAKAHFASKCNHQHDAVCVNCNDLRQLFQEMKRKISTTAYPTSGMKTEALYEFSISEEAIVEWKKHILRSVLQEMAKNDIIKALKPNEVFMQLDWAMKWLPTSYREDQQAFFGKRGIPWHIAVVITRIVGGAETDEPQYEMHTYVHVFDQNQQDSKAVIAIIWDILSRLHRLPLPSATYAKIDTAYIRSDNGGCYHSAATIAAMAQMHEKTGVRVKRWDFSDPQAGKGPCDRAAASIKRQVRMYIDENHDATNAHEFINCAAAHGRIKHTSFIYADVDSPTLYKQATINQISTFNNFEFRENSITAWRAYKIGSGFSIPQRSWSSEKQSIPRLVEKEGTVIPVINEWKVVSFSSRHSHATVLNQGHNEEEDPNDHEEHSTHEEEPKEDGGIFFCPEDGCTSSFLRHSNLLKHLENGNHKYQTAKQDISDYAIDSYKVHIERMQLLQPIPSIEAALRELNRAPEQRSAPAEPPGWALRTTKPQKLFNKKQRQFLIAKFDIGVTTKKKQDAAFVAKEMRLGDKFTQDEWLTAQQIKSFWSREAQRRRSELPPLQGDGSEYIDDTESMLDPDPYTDDHTFDIHEAARLAFTNDN